MFQRARRTLAAILTLLCVGIPLDHARAEGSQELSASERRQGVEVIWDEARKSFPFRDRLRGFEQQVERAKLDVAAIEDAPRYFARLQQLVATLNDGHTFVLPPPGSSYRRSKPSVGIERVDGTPLITWVRNDLVKATPLGSRVISIDTRPVADVVADKLAQVSASTDHQRIDVATSMAFEGQSGSRVTIEYELPDGGRRQATFERGDAWPEGTRLLFIRPWERIRTEFRTFDDGQLAYFSARDFKDASVYNAFSSHLTELQAAKTVIVDVRRNSGGNSRVGYDVLSHFLSAPVLEGRSRAVSTAAPAIGSPSPASSGSTLVDLPRLTIEPKPEALRVHGRLLVLTDHETVSAAEDFVSLALLTGAMQMGETTAGSTGEMVRAALPGGGTLFMISKWDQGASGEEFVGRGFVPEVSAAPTRQSLLSGEDLVLETALRKARSWRAALPEMPGSP